MKKTTIYGILYTLGVFLGGSYMLWAGQTQPLWWVAGALLVSPFVMTALHLLPKFVAPLAAMLLAASVFVILPSYGDAALLYVLFYGTGTVAYIVTYKRSLLFNVYFYGTAALNALAAGAVCLKVREIYGVWDLMGAFRALEKMVQKALTEMEETVSLFFVGEQLEIWKETIRLQYENPDAIVYRMLGLAMIVLMLHLFLSLFIGVRLVFKGGKDHPAMPLRCLSIPSEITICYLVIFFISLFLGNTDYAYALNILNTLMGYLFVLVTIGKVDDRLRRQNLALRYFVIVLMFALAMFSEQMMQGLLFVILTIPGIHYSLITKISKN